MKNCLYCIDVYTVSEGDTLYSIAEKYELPVSLLMKVNGIENPYNLQIGTRLCIPGTADQLPAAPESCAKKHTVKAGDTLYLIAKMHNVKLDALMRANPHIDPYNMLVGTELCIPMSRAYMPPRSGGKLRLPADFSARGRQLLILFPT